MLTRVGCDALVKNDQSRLLLTALPALFLFTMVMPQAAPHGPCDLFSVANENLFWDCPSACWSCFSDRGQDHCLVTELASCEPCSQWESSHTQESGHEGTELRWGCFTWLLSCLLLSSSRPPPYHPHTLTNTSVSNLKKVTFLAHRDAHYLGPQSLPAQKQMRSLKCVAGIYLRPCLYYSWLRKRAAISQNPSHKELALCCRWKLILLQVQKILPRKKNIHYGLGRKVYLPSSSTK